MQSIAKIPIVRCSGYKAHPQITIEIAEDTARDSIVQRRTRQLDIAFVAGRPSFLITSRAAPGTSGFSPSERLPPAPSGCR